MKILLLGKAGQVGGALTPLLRQLAGSSADEVVVTLGRADVDLSDAAALAQAVQRVQPSLIVNAAAHTAVDRAETESEVAFAINAVAPGVLAAQAAKLNSTAASARPTGKATLLTLWASTEKASWPANRRFRPAAAAICCCAPAGSMTVPVEIF